jgi:hypothetical protein
VGDASSKRSDRLRVLRRVYFLAGFALFVGNFLVTGLNPTFGFWTTLALSVLPMWVAIFSSDDLFRRVHRIFWRREWPE